MNVRAFQTVLSLNSEKPVNFILPGGEAIPAHYHVTEVGHVARRFMDCGGTKRESDTCQLQMWVAGDTDHRLTAGKLLQILDMAIAVLPARDLELEVEYEDCAISQYSVAGAVTGGPRVIVLLESKHTDCLAKEACGVAQASGCGDDCCSV